MLRIGITLGDAAGIGPEIIAAAWPQLANDAAAQFVVLGHSETIRRAVALRQVNAMVVGGEVNSSPTSIPCIDCCRDDLLDVAAGTCDARTGRGAFDALVTAIDLALSGKLDAIVTAPLNKEAIHRAGLNYPGHTEILAERCGVADYAMLLYLATNDEGIGIAHTTLHQSMRTAIDAITEDAVLATARLVESFVRRLTRRTPRIGVCALNPHCGEGGLFGDEEQRIIAPAVRRAASEGMNIAGPFPADTLMVAANRGDYNGIVAMYHDQGHIALKLLGMHRAVNVTLGLPIVRTSVAHGTAFDIAWRGLANPQSLIEAVRVAGRLVIQ
ncbi:MAG: 4-hydroxythreonine-4-phosphate dehydrogenase PdxA [Thermoguttaceae bacterium]